MIVSLYKSINNHNHLNLMDSSSFSFSSFVFWGWEVGGGCFCKLEIQKESVQIRFLMKLLLDK